MTSISLLELLQKNTKLLVQNNAYLQVYLRPCRGQDTIIICECRRSAASSTDSVIDYNVYSTKGLGYPLSQFD